MPAKKTDRGVDLHDGRLVIRIDKLTTQYELVAIRTDDAQYGFELRKLDAEDAVVETHHVELYTSNGYHGCDCKGFLRWGHCKHVESLVALEQSGRLSCRRVERRPVEVA